MSRLSGRTALVTGAARGMGEVHARALAAEGAHVAVCDIADDLGEAVALDIGGSYHHLDVASETQWTDTVDAITRSAGPITVLVNNAGIPSLSRVQDTTLEEWNRVMAVNLTGVFLGIRSVVPSMREAGGGVIVNVASDAALVGMPHIAAYAASKWAVRGLTKAAALDLAADKIRVLALLPGIVRTPMAQGVDMDAIAAGQPMGRVGEPAELARMLIFMVVEATYSTGAEFVADGGHTVGVHLPID